MFLFRGRIAPDYQHLIVGILSVVVIVPLWFLPHPDRPIVVVRPTTFERAAECLNWPKDAVDLVRSSFTHTRIEISRAQSQEFYTPVVVPPYAACTLGTIGPLEGPQVLGLAMIEQGPLKHPSWSATLVELAVYEDGTHLYAGRIMKPAK